MFILYFPVGSGFILTSLIELCGTIVFILRSKLDNPIPDFFLDCLSTPPSIKIVLNLPFFGRYFGRFGLPLYLDLFKDQSFIVAKNPLQLPSKVLNVALETLVGKSL